MSENRIERASGADDEPETLIWRGCYSAKAMLGFWIAGALATALSPIVLLLLPFDDLPMAWVLLGLVLVGLWIWLLGVAWYRKFSKAYELTTQRFQHREGLLFRKVDRIELIDIDDVTYRQGPVETMMGVGTITIYSSDTSHPELVMPGIDDVLTVTNQIDDARRVERRKRGLHIEAI